MAKVVISKDLEKKVDKIFKAKSVEIFSLFYELETNPKKGKIISSIGNIAIKELRYKKYRFYFIMNKFKIKFLSVNELNELIIKFIRMSTKKNQQLVIDDIKRTLRNLGEEGF